MLDMNQMFKIDGDMTSDEFFVSFSRDIDLAERNDTFGLMWVRNNIDGLHTRFNLNDFRELILYNHLVDRLVSMGYALYPTPSEPHSRR